MIQTPKLGRDHERSFLAFGGADRASQTVFPEGARQAPGR